MRPLPNTDMAAVQAIIDSLPAVAFEYAVFPDGSRDFVYISKRCEQVLGLSQAEILSGEHWIQEYVHPEDWPSFEKTAQHSIVHSSEMKWEGRIIVDSKSKWIEVNAVRSLVSGDIQKWTGIVIDISDRKKAEQDRVEVEERYRRLVEHVPIGIAIHTKDGIQYINAYGANMLGAKSSSELVGISAMQVIHPDDQQRIRERILNVLSGKSVTMTEVRFQRLDGAILNAESWGFPYVYNGEPAVQTIALDITERKLAEAAARKTETLFYQLFQNTPLAVTLLDENGNVTRINKGFEELFQYTLNELTGKSLNQSIVPQELTSEAGHLNQVISGNQVVRLETKRQRKNGEMLSVIIYGVPVVLEDQKIGIFGMYVDITQQKRVEEELKVRNAELDNFVYKVSHDLRAPLSSILGLVQLANLPGSTDELAEYIRLIGLKAKQLDHFISDVLSHSKNLKLDLKVEPVDFNKIIESTFFDLSYLKGADHVIKNITISPTTFYSDPWRIGEIFHNLISNAIKYRKLYQDETHIRIDISITADECTIHFQDQGIGIDNASLEKIFQMFYRASSQADGSGIGLYIVKNAVDKLAGRITAESEPGQGTIFKITLPNRQLSK